MDSRLKAIVGSGETIVDLGCGAGEILDDLHDEYQTRIGLDVSSRRLDAQGTSGPRNWEFRSADLNTRFPLQDSIADLVVANQVVEHIVDPYHFSAEIYRILRPQGRCVVTTPNIRYLRNIGRVLFSGYGPRTAGGNTLDGAWDDGHLHYFTHRDLLELFEFSGFRSVSSSALIDMSKETKFRRFLSRHSNSRFVREFLSGVIVLCAQK